MKTETILCILLVIMGIVMVTTSLDMYKQLRRCEAVENEYLEVIKTYHQNATWLIEKG